MTALYRQLSANVMNGRAWKAPATWLRLTEACGSCRGWLPWVWKNNKYLVEKAATRHRRVAQW
jgi:hypothetical protein